MNYCPSSQKTTDSFRKPGPRPQPPTKPTAPIRPNKGSVDKNPVKKPTQPLPKQKVQSTGGISNVLQQIASLQKPSLIYRTLVQDKKSPEDAYFQSEKNQSNQRPGPSKSPSRSKVSSVASKLTIEQPSFENSSLYNSKDRNNSSIDKNTSRSNLDLLIASKLQKLGFSSESSLEIMRPVKPLSPSAANKKPLNPKSDTSKPGQGKHKLVYPVFSKATNFSSKFFQSAQEIHTIKESTNQGSNSKREISDHGRGSFRKQVHQNSNSFSDDTNPLDSAFASQKIPLDPITEETFPEFIRIIGEDGDPENDEPAMNATDELAQQNTESTRPFFYPLVSRNKVFYENSRKNSENRHSTTTLSAFNPFLPSHKNSTADLNYSPTEQEITIKVECEAEQIYTPYNEPKTDEPFYTDTQIHEHLSDNESVPKDLKSPAFASANSNINEYFSFEPNERLIKTTIIANGDNNTTSNKFKLNLLNIDGRERSLAIQEINIEAEELESSKDLASIIQITPKAINIWEKSKEGLLSSSLDEIKAEAHTWHAHSHSKRSDSEAGTNPMDSINPVNLQTNDSQLGSQKNSSKTATRYLNYHRRVSKSFTDSGQAFPTMELNRKKSIVTTLISLEKNFPKLDSADVLIQKSGAIEGIAANSYKAGGKLSTHDSYAIDVDVLPKFVRRSLSGNLKQPDASSLISIFNGFGGNECADYLADKLHARFFGDLDCDGLLIQSVKQIFADTDRDFLKQSKFGTGDSSGASSLSLYIIGNSLISINLGDSRCVLSSESGKKITDLTNDHRPDRLSEFNRIIENGGHLERVTLNPKTGEAETHTVKKFQEVKNLNSLEKNTTQGTFGRWRISPSGASVARCFGFKLAKDPELGGCEAVISTEPEVLDFELENADFVLLASEVISERSLREAV
jgi:serine/threonine protein phosphatase PrpC